MGRPIKPKVTLLVDTREQRPYVFSSAHRRDLAWGGVRHEALDAGDYSAELDGEPLPVFIERKSLGDLFGVIGQGRDRFERELERLASEMAQNGGPAYILVEATAAQVREGYERSHVSGEAALGSLLHWSVLYGVHPLFAGDRILGKRITQGILEDFAAHWMSEND